MEYSDLELELSFLNALERGRYQIDWGCSRLWFKECQGGKGVHHLPRVYTVAPGLTVTRAFNSMTGFENGRGTEF